MLDHRSDHLVRRHRADERVGECVRLLARRASARSRSALARAPVTSRTTAPTPFSRSPRTRRGKRWRSSIAGRRVPPAGRKTRSRGSARHARRRAATPARSRATARGARARAPSCPCAPPRAADGVGERLVDADDAQVRRRGTRCRPGALASSASRNTERVLVVWPRSMGAWNDSSCGSNDRALASPGRDAGSASATSCAVTSTSRALISSSSARRHAREPQASPLGVTVARWTRRRDHDSTRSASRPRRGSNDW